MADFKTGPRFRGNPREWERLREAKLYGRSCRVCRATLAETLHHLIPRSNGGSDVEDNLIPVCGSGSTGCHGLLEEWDETASLKLGLSLTVEERRHVVEFKGAYYLSRRYLVHVVVEDAA